MEILDLPPVVVSELSDEQVHRMVQVIGDDPVNASVWGDYLEQSDNERDLFQLYYLPFNERMPLKDQLAQALVACFPAHAHLSVAFQCGEECPAVAVDELEVADRDVTTVKRMVLALSCLWVTKRRNISRKWSFFVFLSVSGEYTR